MKRIINILLAAVCLFTLLTSCAKQNEAITFPDANFESAVRELLYRPTGEITKSDLTGITSLVLDSKGIKSLSGIEHFTALVYLDCNFNELTTIDVSKNTALNSLGCVGN